MFNGFLNRFNRFYGHFVIKKFGAEAFCSGFLKKMHGIFAYKKSIGFGICINNNIFLGQLFTKSREVVQSLFVNNQTIERIAHAYTSGFGIENNFASLFRIAKFIKIGMTNAGSCFYDWNFRMCPHKVDKPFTATWNNQIHITDSVQQVSCSFVAGRQ